MSGKKIIRYFFCSIAAVALIAYAVGCNFKRHTSQTYSRYIIQAPYDVIIVPGMPYDTTGSNFLLKARIFWAKQLYDRGVTRNIIFSGAAVHSPYVEGKVMAILADSLGIPATHIFAETQATHSKENVYFGCLMARKMGFKKMALATDPYQSFFLEGYIAHNTAGMALLPINVDSLSQFDKKLPVINAFSAFVNEFIPIEKREKKDQRR